MKIGAPSFLRGEDYCHYVKLISLKRGEHNITTDENRSRNRSSPRPRGTPGGSFWHLQESKIIPAPAGNLYSS